VIVARTAYLPLLATGKPLEAQGAISSLIATRRPNLVAKAEQKLNDWPKRDRRSDRSDVQLPLLAGQAAPTSAPLWTFALWCLAAGKLPPSASRDTVYKARANPLFSPGKGHQNRSNAADTTKTLLAMSSFTG
jgi:hypothetical protein